MMKTVKLTEKAALQQKGWLWFGAIVGLQMIFVGAMYLSSSLH